MREGKITLIVRVKESFNAACRCISSIKRQSTDAYEMYILAYDEEIEQGLRERYPDAEIFLTKGNKACKNKFNAIVSNLTTEYCMFVDSDSILVPTAIEKILAHDEEVVIFNIAKANDNERFSPYYRKTSFESVAAFLEENQSMWALAFKPEFIRKNNIKLKGIGYEKQALFMLLCIALSTTMVFDERIYLYKWIVSKRKPISDIFYYKNKEDIRRAIKGFARKGDNESRAQVIKIFLLSAIEESYGRPFFRRMKKIASLVRLMWF